MANLTSVGITAGVPTSGTGTVSTIDGAIAVLALETGGNLATVATETTAVAAAAGVTTGTAVVTDANGTLQQYLRGLVKLIAAGISTTIAAGSALIGIVKIGDGTNSAAIKAASTAPLATDPALVVAISPNSINANGQAVMASSAPVVIASNQSAIPIQGNTGVVDFAGQVAAAPASAVAVGGVYESSTPSLTTGKANPILLDSAGNLCVNVKVPFDANGSATSANSQPVVIASDQATQAFAPDISQLLNGKSGVSLTPATQKVNISSATTTANVIAAVSGKQIRILACYLVVGGANNVNWQSHTTTSNGDSALELAANSGIVLNFNPLGWFDTTSGEGLDIVTSTNAQLSGRIVYVAH